MKKILIADDDESLVAVLSMILQSQGYAVVTAGNGEETLTKIKSENPDLLILDIMMPELDGASVAFDLKNTLTPKTIPIIFISGIILKDLKKSVDVSNENTAYLSKPFDYDELISMVSSMLKTS